MAETANVDILINAFTDAAEEALDDVSENLLDLSVSAEPAESMIDEVADELDDATSSAALMGAAFEAADGKVNSLTAAFALLDSRADEAGDEILAAGGKAGVTTGLFSALTLSSEGLSLSLGSLSTKIVVALLPALAALLAALFPLAAVLGTVAAAAAGLAGVFGLVIGSGVIAGFDQLKANLAGVRTQLVTMLDVFGKRFVPMLQTAISLLPALLSNVIAAVGGVDAFADTLSRLGSMAFEAIPMLAGALAGLAREALPLIIDGFEWLMANGGGIFDAMVRTTRQVGPLLIRLGSAFADATPAINRLGVVVLNTVVPALEAFFRVIQGLAAGDWTVLKTQLGSRIAEKRALRGGAQCLVSGVRAMMPTFRALASAFQKYVVPAIGAALNIVGKLAQAFGSLPIWAQKAALAALAGTIAILVGGPITALIAGLAAAALVIDLLSQGFRIAKKAIAGFVDFLAMALITWLNDSIVKLNEFLEMISVVADELSDIPGIDLPDIDTLDTLPGGAGEERRRQAARDARRAGTGQNGDQRMTLDVKGDSPLADLIRRFTSEEQDRRERNQNRRAERQNATGVGR
jgi:hypothetical protein